MIFFTRRVQPAQHLLSACLMLLALCGLANAQTADPNANAATKAELSYLYSLTSKSSGHLIQSNQDIDNACDNFDCANVEALNFAANGNHFPGGVGTGYCNGSWLGFGSPMCTFDNGSGNSTLDQLAKQIWGHGSLIQMDMHFPNPYDNWQNNPIQNVPAPQPCAGAGSVVQGLSGDCTGINDTFVQQMMQAVTTPNTHWNALLDNFARGVQDLQNAGIIVIIRPLHEINGNWFWWSNFSNATQQQLFIYIENYFNGHWGLHNILWEYCIVDANDSTLVGYPGDQYFDLLATDVYFEPTGPTDGYNSLKGHNKPIAFAEYNCQGGRYPGATCEASYFWPNEISAAKQMPLLVWANWWMGRNSGAIAGNTSWAAYMQDPYSILAGAPNPTPPPGTPTPVATPTPTPGTATSCAPTITAPPNNQTLSTPTTITVDPKCNGTFDHIEFWWGASNNGPVDPAAPVKFATGMSSGTFDPSISQIGPKQASVRVMDASGNQIGGSGAWSPLLLFTGSGSTSASSCTVTEQSPTGNAVMSGTASPIAVAISCNGPYDHAKFVMGDSTNTHFGVATLPFGSSSATLNSTPLPNGPYASAVGIFNDASETQLVGWFAKQKETISNTAPTPTPTGICRPDISSLNGVILTSPVSVMPAVSGCSSWPGAHGFVRFEQTKPWPTHYDGNPGSPFVTVPFGPAAYAGYVTLWLNSVTPIGSPSGQVFFTVSAAGPSPTQVPPTPTPIPPTLTPLPPTPTPAPTPTSCQPSLTSPAQLSTVGSPVTFRASAFGCNNWPGASGFLRIEQTSPYPIHYDSNPGSSTTIAPLAAGAYRVYATLWLNSVTQIGVAPPVNFTVDVVPASTATPSPTPSSTPTPTGGPPRGTNLTIDIATHYQTMNGFGVDADTLPDLPGTALDLAFNQNTGIGLTYMRMGMTPDGSPQGPGGLDGPWTNAQAATARGAHVWAQGNSPPAAWKTNGSTTNGGMLRTQYYGAYAQEIVNFVHTAAANGVPLYAFSVQNEPDQSAIYDSCIFTTGQMPAFIHVLGPMLAATNPRTLLMMPESGAFDSLWYYVNAVEADPLASPYTDIYATHQYGNGPTPPQSYLKPVWETEWFQTGSYDPSIWNGLGFAQGIYDAITIGNVSVWHPFWLYTSGNDNQSLLHQDSSGNLQIPKRYYIMGNFSKFVRPGFVRVGTSGGNANVKFLAFENPSKGTPVIVAFNDTGTNQGLTVSLQGVSASTVTPWVTSNSLNLAPQSPVPVTGGSFSTTLPAYSVTTLVGN